MCLFITVNLFVIISLNSTNLLIEYTTTLNIIFVFIDFSLNCFIKDFDFFVFVNVIWKNYLIVANFNDNIIINENLNYFRKSFNLYITFNTFLIVIVKATISTKRNFALIEFDKIKICLIRTIKIDVFLRSVEIDNKNEWFEDSFNWIKIKS